MSQQKLVLAGVGNVELIDKSSGDIVATSKTLVNSGISFSTTAEDVRGGLANKLLAQYFHDSAMALTLEDALFSLQYLALNVGGTISIGGDAMTSEQVTVATANKITVTETPVDFIGLGTIGWYTKAGSEDWTKITFIGNEASVTGLAVGDVVCVKYIANNASLEQFTVSSAFIPAQCYALLTLPLFRSGTDSQSYSNSSKVGEVQVEIPTFMLSGAQELSLTSSGTATTSLSGNALATFTGDTSCDSEGYYAKLKQIIFGKDEFADVKNIVIADSDIELIQGETQTLEVYAMYGSGTAPKLLDNAKLTFTATGAGATVSNAGVVTASTESTERTTIEVVVTSKPTLSAQCVVTVDSAE